MKIWVIGRNYPEKINRMRGLFEIEQAKMLARFGHEVIYVSVVFHPIKKIKKWGFYTWKEDGITISCYSQFFFPERMNIRMQRFKEYVFNNTLEKIEAINGLPDIIHIHYPSMIGMSNILNKYRDKNVFIACTEHWSRVLEKSINKEELKQLSNYVNNSDAFICVGEPLKKSVIELTKTNKNIYVVPNVVETIFQPNFDCKRLNPFTFVAVGRLVPVKQFDVLIESFARLFRENNDVRLLLLGDGEERDKLQQLIKNRNMEAQITMTGTISRKEVAEKISSSNCLICFSRLETFGVPIIEAWACGIPVISSDSLGFSEYWRSELGYIVESNNSKELENKMKEIIKHYSKYDKKIISEYAKEHFAENVIVKRLEGIYQKEL